MTDCARIAILSADNNTIGHLDNTLPDALHFYDDKFVDYLEGAAGVLTFTSPAQHQEAELLAAGNKLAFTYHDRDRYYTIIKAEPDEREVHVTAYSLCLDLINETVGAYEAPSAMTFAQYMAQFCDDDYLVLNINEVSTSSIQHTWDGSSTLLARLYSLANVFSAEVEFLPVLRADYTLDHIEVNVYQQHSDTAQGIGDARNDVVMRFGVNVQSIRKTTDISGLFTSIYATGKDGITISSINRTVNDEDGNPLYVTTTGSPVLYAPQARDRYPSSVAEDGGYIQYTVQTEYESAEDLYAYMLGYLKRVSVPAVSYKVSGYEELNVGDTVRVIDAAFNPPLYLTARVSQQSWSMTQPERNETTFDNFTEMTSAIRESDPQTVDVVARTAARAAALSAFNAREAADDAATAAATADSKAVTAKNTADAAKAAIEAQEQYFWHDTSGAHISDVAEATSGKNVLITSTGMNLYDGTTLLAQFKADEVSLLQNELRMRAGLEQARRQSQMKKDVSVTDTVEQELIIGIDVTDWDDDPSLTRKPNPYISFRYDPVTTKKGTLYIAAERLYLGNPGNSSGIPKETGQVKSNGYEIMTEYMDSYSYNPATGKYIYFNRIGRMVCVRFYYLGAFTAGATDLGAVIPSGLRPNAPVRIGSAKLLKSDGSTLTTTTEIMSILKDDGHIIFVASAAADATWVYADTAMYFTNDAWPNPALSS